MLREKGGMMRTAVGRRFGVRRSWISSASWRVMGAPGKPAASISRAGRIDLVEDEASAGALREDGEKAGAGRGFEHQIRGHDLDGECREIRDRGRGGKLLEFDLLFAADRVGRQICDERGKRSEAGAGIGGEIGFCEVQDLGQFEHVIGVAKRPMAIGGWTAMGLLHDPQQRVALGRSVPGDRVGDGLGRGDRGFGEIEFESCG